MLVSRLPVWLLESCDLERGEKEIAIFLFSRKSLEILQKKFWKEITIFLSEANPDFYSHKLDSSIATSKSKVAKNCADFFLALLTLPKVASK